MPAARPSRVGTSPTTRPRSSLWIAKRIDVAGEEVAYEDARRKGYIDKGTEREA
jgi:hypothetical protein